MSQSESAYHNYDEKIFHAILRIAMAKVRKHGQLFAELFTELFTECENIYDLSIKFYRNILMIRY